MRNSFDLTYFIIYLEHSLALLFCDLKNLDWPLSRSRGEEPSLLVQ